MPFFKLFTNLPKYRIPINFTDKIIPVLAKAVNKPADKFICVVVSDCLVSFGGNCCICGAVATLESIGNLGVEDNKRIAQQITAFVGTELGIEHRFIFLSFYDLKGQDVAEGGKTLIKD